MLNNGDFEYVVGSALWSKNAFYFDHPEPDLETIYDFHSPRSRSISYMLDIFLNTKGCFKIF